MELPRLRLQVFGGEDDGFPGISAGRLVNIIGTPVEPEYLVIELETPTRARTRTEEPAREIRYVALRAIGWRFAAILQDQPSDVPQTVQIWYVFDKKTAMAQKLRPDRSYFVARGEVKRIPA